MSINIQNAHRTKICVPHGELRSVMDWCTQHCEQEWRVSITETDYTFYFESEKDFVTFMIWKK